MIAHMHFNKTFNPKVIELFIRGRKFSSLHSICKWL